MKTVRFYVNLFLSQFGIHTELQLGTSIGRSSGKSLLAISSLYIRVSESINY